MCKKFLFICSTLLGTQAGIIAKEPPLTHRIISSTDGVQGFMDKEKIKNIIWLINEINNIHEGNYRTNNAGVPDPRGKNKKEATFRGAKQTLKELIALESKKDTFSEQEKSEFEQLFQIVKEYFDKVNKVLAPAAAASHSFMYDLTEDFCRKHNRPNSLLLNWNKGDEIELYRKSVTSFKIFNSLSTDLMNFLSDVIHSFPKAFNDYKQSKEEGTLQPQTSAAGA